MKTAIIKTYHFKINGNTSLSVKGYIKHVDNSLDLYLRILNLLDMLIKCLLLMKFLLKEMIK